MYYYAIGSITNTVYAKARTKSLLFQELQKKFPSTHKRGTRTTNTNYIYNEGAYLYIAREKTKARFT